MNKKEDTILYLRHLYNEDYTFSNFKLKDVIDFIDELEDERIQLLKKIDNAIEFVKTQYNTYPSAEEWRKALLEILEGVENEH